MSCRGLSPASIAPQAPNGPFVFARDTQPGALRKLRLLNNTLRLDDLRVPPGNRLEALHGERRGQHSIRINDQWRICFVWRQNNAHEVEIVDYH